MIYAPPYLIRRRVEGDVDRSRTRNVSDGNPDITQGGKHWKANNGAPLLLQSTTRSRRQHNSTYYDIAPTVENGYYQVKWGIGHTRRIPHVYGGSSCLTTGDQTTVISMATQAIMACHTSMATG